MPDQNVFSELTRLQNELDRLSTAVDEIEKAKTTAVSVVNTGHNLNDQYGAQNKKVETLHNVIQEQIEQVKKLIANLDAVDFPKRLDKIEETVNNLWHDTHNRLNTVQTWLYVLTGICALSLILNIVQLTK